MALRKCKDCKEGWGEHLFMWLADSLWKEIGCKPNDFLCANCTLKRLDKGHNYIYVVPGPGKYTVAAYEITMTETAKPSKTAKPYPYAIKYQMSSEKWFTVGFCETKELGDTYIENTAKEMQLPKERWKIEKV